jgi:hypothetical protein
VQTKLFAPEVSANVRECMRSLTVVLQIYWPWDEARLVLHLLRDRVQQGAVIPDAYWYPYDVFWQLTCHLGFLHRLFLELRLISHPIRLFAFHRLHRLPAFHRLHRLLVFIVFIGFLLFIVPTGCLLFIVFIGMSFLLSIAFIAFIDMTIAPVTMVAKYGVGANVLEPSATKAHRWHIDGVRCSAKGRAWLA